MREKSTEDVIERAKAALVLAEEGVDINGSVLDEIAPVLRELIVELERYERLANHFAKQLRNAEKYIPEGVDLGHDETEVSG